MFGAIGFNQTIAACITVYRKKMINTEGSRRRTMYRILWLCFVYLRLL